MNIYNTITSIIILLDTNIIVFSLYDVLRKMHENKIVQTLLKEQNKYYQKQLDILRHTNETRKEMYHDYKNHLSVVIGYIKNEDIEMAIKFLEEINIVISGNNELSKTGNMDIDSILNYKLNEAIKKDISISLESKIPININISSLDIVGILGNLLDNAIEASCKVRDNRKIGIKIEYKNNILFIHVENTFTSSIIYVGNRIKSTKKDNNNHGIGISNIEKITKKYNGTMNIHHNDNNNNIFTVNIILYIN